jgi:RHS repeat-associated protein/uncharacterized repeat protein (TIGR01451 family)
MLIRIAVGFNSAIGIDHHEPSNQVILSVNYYGGRPHNFELVAPDGTRTRFSDIAGLTDEVKITCVRTGPHQGGFQAGEFFTGTGSAGEVVRVSPDGSVVQNPWVRLPGEPGLMRGSLFQDRYGVFGGDLIVVTTAGGVWRITAAGQATRLAHIGTHLEGVTTVPDDPAKYGPWAGRILIGAEHQGLIYTVSAAGAVSSYQIGISPEDIEIIPENENFYGVDYGAGTLWGAPASAFAGMVGDVLIAQEGPGFLWHVRWDAASGQFVKKVLAQVAQWEHVTFSPAGLDTVPPVEPGTVEPCPPVGGPPPRRPSRLTYLGPTSATCGHEIRLLAQLTDETGSPVAGRALTFTLAARTATARTDAAGLAGITVTPEAAGSPLPLSIAFSGEPELLPSSTSATIDVSPAESAVVYTGRTLLASGASQTVSARLLDAVDGRPLAGQVLTFQAGSQSASGITDANGVATADLTIPSSELPGELTVSFAGDGCHGPASARVSIVVYAPTSFVVWGGNPAGLKIGQRVNFWGAQWPKQVAGGDYDAQGDFKGHAILAGALRVCQPDARTTSRPPLDSSCWTSKPGQSLPPEPPLPRYIGVLVATSIAKQRSVLYGNIAAVVVVEVSPDPPYGAVPGKPGFGTIVGAVEDGAGLFPQPPRLAASQSAPDAVLPGSRFPIAVNVSNVSTARAMAVSVRQRFDDLTPPSATVDLGSVEPGTTETASTEVAAPAVPPRQEGETSAAYLGRLESADGKVLPAGATVSFRDAAGQPLPDLTATSHTRLELPRLAPALLGAACVGPGSEIPYEITVTSLGRVAAASGILRLRFPDRTSREETLGSLAPGETYQTAIQWTVPAIPPQGTDEAPEDYRARLAALDGQTLTAVAEVTWKDTAGNDYGPVEQETRTLHRVPIVTSTPQPPSPLLPGGRTALVYAVQNAGTGNAFQIGLRMTGPNGSTESPAPFRLGGGSQATSVQIQGTAPGLAGREPGESDDAYLARLDLADEQPLAFEHRLEWQDAAGNGYGPILGSVFGLQVLPVLELSLAAPATALAGDAIGYTATVMNRGHAAAGNVIVVFTLPDGSARTVQLPTLAPGESRPAPSSFVIPRTPPAGTLTAGASLTWRDTAAVPNSYGPIAAGASTRITQPNEAPVVEAGADQTITFPAAANLAGSVSDATFPPGGALRVTWSKVNGPGNVTFATPDQVATAAGFSAPGTYLLRLTATDGELTGRDEMSVTVKPEPGVNQAPVVRAGNDTAITLPAALQLAGSVTDDGLPEGSAMAVAWIRVSGPGTVAFEDRNAAATRASFSQQGIYVLRLTATDGELTTSDELTVTVNPASILNQPPEVEAGPDQTITLSDALALRGDVLDDGRPVGAALIVTWSKVSGPGAVLFSDPGHALTTATFGAAGTYVLRLSASDSQFTASDEVTVTVTPPVRLNQPPVVDAGPSQILELPNAAVLQGIVTDDGLPQGGVLILAWSQVSGPGPVVFENPGAASTVARFPSDGTYVLRFTADDGEFRTSDELSVTVQPAPQMNQRPSVQAGADQTVTLPSTIALSGAVTDDGLPSGGALTSRWTQVSGPGPVTFADPGRSATTATFVEPGTYVLRLTADDSQLRASDEVTVLAQAPAGPRPAVAIASPRDGAEITTLTDVVGSVSGGVWKLEHRLDADDSSPNPWVVFAAGSGPVSNGRLASFDPTLLLNGTYAVRLTATTASGSSSASISLVVTGNQKVGNFSLSFLDVDLPMAGIPIQVIRTYDSRDKRRGDFGVGWTLSIKDVRLEKSAVLGAHWEETRSGGFLPTYCLRTTRPTTVTITFPTGKVYKFEATTSPACQQIAPLEAVDLGFRPAAGTQGSLVALDEVEALVYLTDGVSPGPAELVGYDTLAPINPVLFRLTIEDGTEYVIHQRNGLQSIREPRGSTITFGPEGIIHSYGKSVTFVRDGQGRITRITDPAGGSRRYEYDSAGDLIAHTDAVGQTTRFVYNGSHGLLDVIDPLGRRPLRNEYDESGRLVRHLDAEGRAVEYTHDLSTRQEIVRDRTGNQTVYEYDICGNVVRITDPEGGVTSYTYDARDNRISETDPNGSTTASTYDAAGNRTSVTDPLGNRTGFSYNSRQQPVTITDPQGRATTTSYDGRGNPLSVTDAAGGVMRMTYPATGSRPTSVQDSAGNVTQLEYDASGNLVKMIDALGNTRTYTYDANNNKTSETGARRTATETEILTTRWVYDKLNRLIETRHPDGSVERIEYGSNGQKSRTVDTLGRETRFEYDDAGRLIRTVRPDGTSESSTYDGEGRCLTQIDRVGRITSFTYDGRNQLVRTTHPDGSSIRHEMDAKGRILATTNELGNVTRYEYDAAGRNTRVTDPLGNATSYTYDETGNVTSMTDAHGRVTSFEYDANGRRTRVLYTDGTSEQVEYNALGDVVARVDQAGIRTRYEYDPLHRLSQVIDALGGRTEYGYDEQNNRVSQKDANGNITRFEFDARRRLIKKTLPLGGTEMLRYNAAGNLVERTDSAGRTTRFEHDAMGRLLAKIPDASFGVPAIRFTYNPNGTRESMVDASGATSYEYDLRDRLTVKRTPWGALLYTYDARGNLLSLQSTNPEGASVTYAYDPLDRLTSVTDDRLPDGTARYAYDTVGNLHEMRLPNGLRSTYGYDLVNRLTSLDCAGAEPVAGYAYGLSPTGHRLTIAELGGRRVGYTYDALARLTGEAISGAADPLANGAVGYLYDPAYNRLARTSTVAALPAATYAYDANDRLLGETYDANGNVTALDGKTFTYDFENRLISSNGDEEVLQYDGDGNRIARTLGGVTTHYLVDAQNPTHLSQVIEEIAGDTVQRVYVYGLDLLSQRQILDGVWTVSFYGQDGFGNVRYLTDVSGRVTDTYEYDAFGNLLARTGTTPNERLFGAQVFDARLQLYFLRARYYNPATGRFVSLDVFPGDPHAPASLHRYLYGSANPLSFPDPTGYGYFAATVALVVNLISMLSAFLMRTALHAILGGFILGVLVGAVDAWLGADPVVEGALTGGFVGAVFMLALFLAQGFLVATAVLAVLGLSLNLAGVIDSIRRGRPAQAIFRLTFLVLGIALSLRGPRGSGANPPLPRPNPAEAGTAFGTAIKSGKGRMAAIVNRASEMGLTQQEAVEFISAAVRAMGYDLFPHPLPTGEMAVCSVAPGSTQPILVVRPNGTAYTATATIDFNITTFQTSITNIVPDAP